MRAEITPSGRDGRPHGDMALPVFRLEEYMAEWEFTARFNATASDAETLTLDELLALASAERLREWHTLPLGYRTTTGAPGLRAAIAATYENVSPEQILTFVGAEEGIFCAMHALLGPGDHAVVLAPNYQSAEEVPRSICETSAVALRWRESGGWTLDLDEVDAACRPNTKLLAINFPNNPTGAMPPPGQHEELLRIAADRGLYVLSDEVYRGLERDGITPLPQAADLYARALSLGVMSKAYGLPGLRIGWIACRDAEVLRRMERMRHYLSICSAGPSEMLATIALEAREVVLDRNRTIARGNLEVLAGFFARHERLFEWYVPPGSCVSYPRYLGADGVETFCRRAVRDSSVLLLPASIFQSSLVTIPSDRFRIGFGRRNLREAVDALDAFIATDSAASV